MQWNTRRYNLSRLSNRHTLACSKLFQFDRAMRLLFPQIVVFPQIVGPVTTKLVYFDRFFPSSNHAGSPQPHNQIFTVGPIWPLPQASLAFQVTILASQEGRSLATQEHLGVSASLGACLEDQCPGVPPWLLVSVQRQLATWAWAKPFQVAVGRWVGSSPSRGSTSDRTQSLVQSPQKSSEAMSDQTEMETWPTLVVPYGRYALHYLRKFKSSCLLLMCRRPVKCCLLPVRPLWVKNMSQYSPQLSRSKIQKQQNITGNLLSWQKSEFHHPTKKTAKHIATPIKKSQCMTKQQ